MTPVRAQQRPLRGVQEAAADVYRLALPVPFSAASVNAYLIVDEPLTLVDVGANMPGAVAALQARLGLLGYCLADVGLILLTHPHVDHSGLIGPLSEHTDADIATLAQMVPCVEDFWTQATREETLAVAVMERYGIPQDAVERIRAKLRDERQWSSVARVSRRLSDGATVALAEHPLTVHHRPGHSPVDTVFHDATNGLLFVGDHLLEKTSPSPAVWAWPEGPVEVQDRPLPLVEYRRSLALTRAAEATTTLPGHGLPIDDHRAVIDNRLCLQARRVERLAAMLADGPATAFQLAHRTWGRFAEAYPFRSLCEIVVHMDLLVASGCARELADPHVVHYERI